MSLFVIGDTHLSLGVDKPMDIFKGWHDYVSRLEEMWNSVVGESDVTVIPGDISWAMNLSQAKADFDFLNSLNGKKIIGKGNHDYWWPTMNKLNLFLKENAYDSISFLFNNSYLVEGYAVCGTRGWFYDAESSDIEKVLAREAGRLRRSIESGMALGGEPVVFLHYPPVLEGKECDAILNVLNEYNIKRCYFGHLHSEKNQKFRDFEHRGIRFSLISADYIDFCPQEVFV